MSRKFSGKTVLVTGGAQGIGKALSVRYAEEGAFVYFCDRNREAGETLEKELAAKGLEAVFVEGDVSKEKDVKAVIETVISKGDKLDILINNAGVSRFIPLEELSFDEWKEIIHTNLSSVFLFAKYGAAHLSAGGSVINISSTRATMSEPDSEAYAASKGGIIALTHALSASLAGKVRVNSVSPGWIETANYDELRSEDHEQHFSKRVGNPEDIVKACFYLSDFENSFVTGENIVVDGGMTRKMIYRD
ncbi:SDR family NAD(P)-dependent oxidoreductase [Evansella clarkii]|uniref:SDR family NAD(P)-dependent oxidoreductase n=1 Tax=Evansella clarkii TaxID=79879 RepID=UPI000B448CA3|nr:SDR family oxidoreductase [Evansella clarkii]